jgi:hypothetical protein
MAVTTTVLADTAEYTDYREDDASIGYVGYRREWKAGTPGANEELLQGQLETILDNVRAVANGSGTFANNTIRDAAIRTTARALVILIRLQQRKLDAVD